MRSGSTAIPVPSTGSTPLSKRACATSVIDLQKPLPLRTAGARRAGLVRPSISQATKGFPMRVHTTTVLSLSALAVLALAGCTHGSATSPSPMSSTTVPVPPDSQSAPAPSPLSSTALAKRLLDESDLGEDYTRMPQRTAAHDDVTVIGCPALAKLGDAAVNGASLAFPPARPRRPSPTPAAATPSCPRSCTATPRTRSPGAWEGSSRR